MSKTKLDAEFYEALEEFGKTAYLTAFPYTTFLSAADFGREWERKRAECLVSSLARIKEGLSNDPSALATCIIATVDSTLAEYCGNGAEVGK